MDNEPNDPEVIRLQMEETRTSLQEKLETLEQQVVNTVQDSVTAVTDTVESVKAAVQDTVDTVKDTFQETVDTVKDTVQGTVDSVKDTVTDTVDSVKDHLDITHHVERHPWAMFLGSAAVGYFGTCLLEHSSSTPHRTALPPGPVPAGEPFTGESQRRRFTDDGQRTAARRTEEAKQETPTENWWSSLNEAFGPELAKLKGLAIGTVMGIARDMIASSVPPPMVQELSQVIDNVTVKLGGHPVQANLLGDSCMGGGNGKHHSLETGRSAGFTARHEEGSLASSWHP